MKFDIRVLRTNEWDSYSGQPQYLIKRYRGGKKVAEGKYRSDFVTPMTNSWRALNAGCPTLSDDDMHPFVGYSLRCHVSADKPGSVEAMLLTSLYELALNRNHEQVLGFYGRLCPDAKIDEQLAYRASCCRLRLGFLAAYGYTTGRDSDTMENFVKTLGDVSLSPRLRPYLLDFWGSFVWTAAQAVIEQEIRALFPRMPEILTHTWAHNNGNVSPIHEIASFSKLGERVAKRLLVRYNKSAKAVGLATIGG